MGTLNDLFFNQRYINKPSTYHLHRFDCCHISLSSLLDIDQSQSLITSHYDLWIMITIYNDDNVTLYNDYHITDTNEEQWKVTINEIMDSFLQYIR